MPYICDWTLLNAKSSTTCLWCHHWGIQYRDWKHWGGLIDRQYKCMGCGKEWVDESINV